MYRAMPVGGLQQPHYTGCVDGESGVVAALAGQRVSPHDEDGNPRSVPWPRSRALTLASLRGPWNPRALELPFPALTVGIVRERLVAVDGQTTVACIDLNAPDRPCSLAHLPGRFVAFAGPYGLITSSIESDLRELSLFAPAW